MSKRPVIVHFHLFKNAGTSVDRILKDNFGDRCGSVERENSKKLVADTLVKFIRDNPELKAVSSHTAVVSLPLLDDIEIIPIFFMRHPIDRIRSAFSFERNQQANTPSAIKAKEGDFAHYMKWHFSTGAPGQVSNFHARRLKDFHTFTPNRQVQFFEPRAMAALEALPCVGLVEKFDESMARFESLIQPHFPEFRAKSAWENRASGSETSLTDNLAAFEAEIGAEIYQELLDVNAIDFSLYNFIKAQFT